ncbi:S-layer homology domain-containing protein [Sporosarcina sp. SAFN-010]|uniref:S-layer homology domain-containing protein n=1 Tax=Sporosarcina sp. SAFN-010 TaxID=3387273 RepID=UPI003F7D88EF
MLTPENPKVIYTLDLKEPGKISTTIRSYFPYADYQILDEDGTRIVDGSMYSGSPNTPDTEMYSTHLEKGRYTIHFSTSRSFPEGVSSKKFTILPEFSATKNNEIEPNDGTELAELLPLDNQPVRGLISWSETSDYFKIELKEAGKVSFDYNGYFKSSSITLLDKNGESIFNETLYSGQEFTPQKYSNSTYLEAGTYYFKISKYAWQNLTGVYTLQASFQAASSDDVEPNNGTEIAQDLLLGEANQGLISWNDQIDYYQFDVPNAMKLNLSAHSYFKYFNIEVFNKNGDNLLNKSLYDGAENNPEKFSTEIELAKGTYFVKISKSTWYSNHGLYRILISDPSANKNFIDVTPAYKDAVDYLVKNKITQGTSSTTFGISTKIKRIDAAIMLAKALGIEGFETSSSVYKDVPSRGFGAVNALSKRGIMKGKSDTLFGADSYLTRGEVALILTRAYSLDGTGTTTNFADVSSSYKNAVNALVKNNITQGKSPSLFGTTSSITRGEIAIFLYRASLLSK